MDETEIKLYKSSKVVPFWLILFSCGLQKQSEDDRKTKTSIRIHMKTCPICKGYKYKIVECVLENCKYEKIGKKLIWIH